MLNLIDNFLNSYTIYRVVLYGLIIEATATILFGFFGILPYPGINLLISAVLLIAVCYLTNKLLAKIFKALTNYESFAITALILFLILIPANSFSNIFPLIFGAILAMASKYILAINKKHIFNPAAVAALILGFFSNGASWWVANPPLSPITIIVGLLIVRKIHRFSLLFSFSAFSITAIFASAFLSNRPIVNIADTLLLSWPIVFFSTIMLTEPLTTPPTKKLQIIYGALTGILFGSQFQIGPIFSTPELALVLGNIYSYWVSPRYKLYLKLKQKMKLSPQIYHFEFTPDQKFNFQAGQYLEWTLPHQNPDSRGNRRFFTTASSPTEENILLGVRIIDNSSSFKKALLALGKDTIISCSQLAGEFTLPKNKEEKLVFVAGGIGITPFRSMVKFLMDTKDRRDIVLFYAASTPQDFVYKELFDQAGKTIGLKTIYAVGRIDKDAIKKVPDFENRKFYLSGPQGAVNAYKILLSQLSVKKTNIKTDYFPGY